MSKSEQLEKNKIARQIAFEQAITREDVKAVKQKFGLSRWEIREIEKKVRFAYSMTVKEFIQLFYNNLVEITLFTQAGKKIANLDKENHYDEMNLLSELKQTTIVYFNYKFH